MPNITDSTTSGVTFQDSTTTNTGVIKDSSVSGTIFTDSTTTSTGGITDSATTGGSNIIFKDSATISELLNKDILNLLANSPEFVAELKEMLVLNTELLNAFRALKLAFENNLNFTQEHAEKLSDISTRFEADFKTFTTENTATKTSIAQYLLELQTLKTESTQSLEKATQANTTATQNIQSLNEILGKITSLEALEAKVDDILSAVDNPDGLTKDLQEAVNNARDSIQTIKQESIKEFQDQMADNVSVQALMEKIDNLQMQIEAWAQEMIARQAQIALPPQNP